MSLLRPSACDSLPFNWNSNFIYSVGGTHCFDNGWNVSAGYNFIANSIPGSNYNLGHAGGRNLQVQIPRFHVQLRRRSVMLLGTLGVLIL